MQVTMNLKYKTSSYDFSVTSKFLKYMDSFTDNTESDLTVTNKCLTLITFNHNSG